MFMEFYQAYFSLDFKGCTFKYKYGKSQAKPKYKIHQNASCTTHYGAAGSYEHLSKNSIRKGAASRQKREAWYSEPQWMKLRIMGAGSRWNPSSTSKEGAVAGKLLGLPTLASSSFLATCVSLNGRIQSMANLGFPAFVQKLGIYFTQLMA